MVCEHEWRHDSILLGYASELNICPGDDTKSTTNCLTQLTEIMSKQVLISMLRQGNTGAEILSILDVIANDTVADAPVADVTPAPTLQEIEF